MLLEPGLDGRLTLRDNVVEQRIVRQEAHLELGRILEELLHVIARGGAERHGHGNVADADRYVLLRVRIEIKDNAAAGVGEDRTGEAPDIALINDAVLDLPGNDAFELVDADRRVVLVQRVDAAAAGGQAVVSNQERCRRAALQSAFKVGATASASRVA